VPLTAVELTLALLLLVLVGAAGFGSHVIEGGFVMDDWSNLAKTQYLASCCGPGSTGQGLRDLPTVAGNMLNDGPAGYHLGLTVVAPIAHFLLGIHMGYHLALALALGVAMSACLYALLRVLGLAALHSAVIAALVLLFPFSDSTRLWAMASFNQLAVVLTLLGALLALRGLRARGAGAQVALHASALVLCVAGMAIYELSAGLVVLSFLLYAGRTSWRGVAVRAVVDVLVTLIALRVLVAVTLPRGVLPLAEWPGHARLIAEQALLVLGRVVLPFDGLPHRALGALVLAALVAAGLAWWRLPAGHVLRAPLRPWLVLAAGGLATVVAGYLPVVPSFYGAPLDAGIENRLNMIAGVGYVALVYAAAGLAGTALAHRLRRPPTWALAAPLVAAAVTTAGFLLLLGDSKRAYADSHREQVRVLRAIGAVPRVPVATFFTFGGPSFTAPGVPVFAWIWDLNNAAKVWLQAPDVQAHPMLQGSFVQCAADGVYPQGPFGNGAHQRGTYGATYFVNTETGAATFVRSRAECRRVAPTIVPGPVQRGTRCVLAYPGGPATRSPFACPEDRP